MGVTPVDLMPLDGAWNQEEENEAEKPHMLGADESTWTPDHIMKQEEEQKDPATSTLVMKDVARRCQPEQQPFSRWTYRRLCRGCCRCGRHRCLPQQVDCTQQCTRGVRLLHTLVRPKLLRTAHEGGW